MNTQHQHQNLTILVTKQGLATCAHDHLFVYLYVCFTWVAPLQYLKFGESPFSQEYAEEKFQVNPACLLAACFEGNVFKINESMSSVRDVGVSQKTTHGIHKDISFLY